MTEMESVYAVVITDFSCVAYVYDEEGLEEQVKFYKSHGWKVYVFKKVE